MATFTELPSELQRKIFNYKTKMDYDDRWGWADAIEAGIARVERMEGGHRIKGKPWEGVDGRGKRDITIAEEIYHKEYGVWGDNDRDGCLNNIARRGSWEGTPRSAPPSLLRSLR